MCLKVVDTYRGAVELIDQEAVAALKLFSNDANGVREVNGLLVDQQFLKSEGYEGILTRRICWMLRKKSKQPRE